MKKFSRYENFKNLYKWKISKSPSHLTRIDFQLIFQCHIIRKALSRKLCLKLPNMLPDAERVPLVLKSVEDLEIDCNRIFQSLTFAGLKSNRDSTADILLALRHFFVGANEFRCQNTQERSIFIWNLLRGHKCDQNRNSYEEYCEVFPNFHFLIFKGSSLNGKFSFVVTSKCRHRNRTGRRFSWSEKAKMPVCEVSYTMYDRRREKRGENWPNLWMTATSCWFIYFCIKKFAYPVKSVLNW